MAGIFLLLAIMIFCVSLYITDQVMLRYSDYQLTSEYQRATMAYAIVAL